MIVIMKAEDRSVIYLHGVNEAMLMTAICRVEKLSLTTDGGDRVDAWRLRLAGLEINCIAPDETCDAMVESLQAGSDCDL